MHTQLNQPTQPSIVQLQVELWTRKMETLPEAARARVSKKIDDLLYEECTKLIENS